MMGVDIKKLMQFSPLHTTLTLCLTKPLLSVSQCLSSLPEAADSGVSQLCDDRVCIFICNISLSKK